MENKWHETVKKIYSSLDLDRKVVGIKLFKNEDEFKNEESLLPAKKMNYCLAVASASKGHSILKKLQFEPGPYLLLIYFSDFLLYLLQLHF
ncbi:MAG TPA: hypothetical protein DDY58_19235 [Terrisporobacter glycolicus]|nr:hypothetical protein [Terrisporobacter hibernicus]